MHSHSYRSPAGVSALRGGRMRVGGSPPRTMSAETHGGRLVRLSVSSPREAWGPGCVPTYHAAEVRQRVEEPPRSHEIEWATGRYPPRIGNLPQHGSGRARHAGNRSKPASSQIAKAEATAVTGSARVPSSLPTRATLSAKLQAPVETPRDSSAFNSVPDCCRKVAECEKR